MKNEKCVTTVLNAHPKGARIILRGLGVGPFLVHLATDNVEDDTKPYTITHKRSGNNVTAYRGNARRGMTQADAIAVAKELAVVKGARWNTRNGGGMDDWPNHVLTEIRRILAGHGLR